MLYYVSQSRHSDIHILYCNSENNVKSTFKRWTNGYVSNPKTLTGECDCNAKACFKSDSGKSQIITLSVMQCWQCYAMLCNAMCYVHNMMIWYDIRCATLRYYMIWYDIWYMIYDMVWYMIWYMIWCMIWYMIWYDMIWYDMIWYDMIWYDAIRYDTIRYDTIWYDNCLPSFPAAWINVGSLGHGAVCEEDPNTTTNRSCQYTLDGLLLSKNFWLPANPGIGSWLKVSKEHLCSCE